METYFEKDCNTSWIIDALEKKYDEVYSFDTLKLYRVFKLRLNSENDKVKCFMVSLYIKRDEDCNNDAYDSKLTLSKIRNSYSEKYFDEEDATEDMFLSFIINQLNEIDCEQKIQDVIFSKSIAFKAQALVDWSKRGKTKIYHIVGVCLEKIV